MDGWSQYVHLCVNYDYGEDAIDEPVKELSGNKADDEDKNK